MPHEMLIRWCILPIGGIAALYGLHRLALRMEERGLIYYLNRKPRGGSMVGSLVAFQRAIEPRAEHVLRVSDIRHVGGDEGAPGPGPEPGRDSTGDQATRMTREHAVQVARELVARRKTYRALDREAEVADVLDVFREGDDWIVAFRPEWEGRRPAQPDAIWVRVDSRTGEARFEPTP